MHCRCLWGHPRPHQAVGVALIHSEGINAGGVPEGGSTTPERDPKREPPPTTCKALHHLRLVKEVALIHSEGVNARGASVAPPCQNLPLM